MTEYTKHTSVDVKTAIQEWESLINNNTLTEVINRLHPPIQEGQTSCIKINLDTILNPREAPSIYVYIGINLESEIMFYFIDSYSANLPDSDPPLTPYFGFKFKSINNILVPPSPPPPPPPSPPQISYVEASERCLNWRNFTNRHAWATAVGKENIVRLFTIPDHDLKKHISEPNPNGYFYLFLGITFDGRPNEYEKKIELIVSKSPAPSAAITTTTTTPLYYNITTPYPPF